MKFPSCVFWALLLLCTAAIAQTDGPATLPIAQPSTVAVSLNTPKYVPAGSSLQAAINSAVCGDNLVLDPTGVWYGPFTVNPVGCDAGHWVTIQSLVSPVLNPVTGRVVPGQQLPKLVMVHSNDRLNYGSFVNIVGLDIGRQSGSGVVYNLAVPVPGAHDYIFNSNYIHGTPTDETTRGVFTSGSTRGAFLNNWFAEFHCRAISGACGDSQAISGGLTTTGDEGVFLIQNNELEASGEIVFFGGGTANVVPHDITVIGNHFWKNPCWNPFNPCYAPTAGANGVLEPWSTKNFFELKNAQRVLFDKNVAENNWGGFTQIGFAVLLTTKNPGTCPVCLVANVTIRNSRFYNTGLALQIGFGQSDNGAWGAGAYNYSIHDLVFDQLNDPGLFAVGHWLVQISSGLSPTGQVMHDVSLSHLTLNVPKWHPKNNATDGGGHGFLTLGGPVGTPMYNIHFDSSVLPSGNDPILSTGGGPSNCAYTVQLQGAPIVPTCWAGNSSFLNNTVISSYSAWKGQPNTTMTSAGANPDVTP